MTDSSETEKQQGVKGFLSSELFLAALITIMTIFTAVTAYQASLMEGDSLKQFFIAQSDLTDSNSFYVEQGQELFYDQSVYDQYQIALLRGEEDVAEYYYEQLSQAGAEAVERSPDAPFDEQYQAELFSEAEGALTDFEASYDAAIAFNVKGDRLGLVTTILAVGLAFAAWAALAPEDSRIRIFFAVLGIFAFILAIVEYVRIMMTS